MTTKIEQLAGMMAGHKRWLRTATPEQRLQAKQDEEYWAQMLKRLPIVELPAGRNGVAQPDELRPDSEG